MKTELTPLGVVDMLVVARALPQEEVDQIEAFSGIEYNYEHIALQLYNSPGPKYCIRVKESKEPIVVAGIVQVGTYTWRTWFLANQRAWDEFGREVTKHTVFARKQLLENQEHMRIETLALASREKARKWYELCGMEYESTLRGYGKDGQSAVMYVSVVGSED